MQVVLSELLKNILGKIASVDNKVETVKLWENATPTSDFGAQTISLDLREYDEVIIYFRAHVARQNYGIERYGTIPVIGRKNEYSSLQFVSILADANTGVYQRPFYVSDTGVQFYTMIYGWWPVTGTGGQSITTANFCQPKLIYGIKGVN